MTPMLGPRSHAFALGILFVTVLFVYSSAFRCARPRLVVPRIVGNLDCWTRSARISALDLRGSTKPCTGGRNSSVYRQQESAGAGGDFCGDREARAVAFRYPQSRWHETSHNSRCRMEVSASRQDRVSHLGCRFAGFVEVVERSSGARNQRVRISTLERQLTAGPVSESVPLPRGLSMTLIRGAGGRALHGQVVRFPDRHFFANSPYFKVIIWSFIGKVCRSHVDDLEITYVQKILKLIWRNLMPMSIVRLWRVRGGGNTANKYPLVLVMR